MKLWRISQDQNNGYDAYDSAVVAAETQEDAKMMHPSDGENIGPSYFCDWVETPDSVICEYIGEASPEITKRRVICASYNAG